MNKPPELAAARQARIAGILSDRAVVRVNELTDALDVSSASIRRDLAEMERRGLLVRVHGGAVATGSRLDEPLFDDKTALAAEEKRRIVRRALAFVQPNDSVFLDGGSTVLALANLLADRADLTVVTNSMRVAGLLSGSGPRMILAGGELRRVSQTFVGALTRPVLGQIHCDKAFVGTIGLSVEHGMTTTDPREAETKESVMAHAHQVILLADSSKIGTVSFVEFGRLRDVHVLITDTGVSKQALRPFTRKGIQTIRV